MPSASQYVSPQLPASWRDWCQEEFDKPYFQELVDFLAEQQEEATIFPPVEDTFTALQLTPFDDVKVVILGQDPYHDEGQAHGLCFSVRKGVKLPPSLKNIFKELQADLGLEPPDHGCLESWARNGVLMLNTVLTVQAHKANSHRKRGWEQFTDAIIKRLNDRTTPVIFVLWGKPAQKKAELIDESRHRVIKSAHPSPLSARTGFFGSRPFSQVNAMLEELKIKSIDWKLE